MIRERAKVDWIDDETFKEYLPCSLEAVDHLGELYIEGKCKLTSELKAAKRIPESERRLISFDYLESQEANTDENTESKESLKNGQVMVLMKKPPK